MQALRRFLVFPLIVLMAASSSAFAGQQHVVAPGELAAAIANSAAKHDTQRATVREALAQPQVQAVASKLGLDAARAAAAVELLSGADLEDAANAAQQVNDQLVGGASTVVISTTMIIIILLVVILLVVALK